MHVCCSLSGISQGHTEKSVSEGVEEESGDQPRICKLYCISAGRRSCWSPADFADRAVG